MQKRASLTPVLNTWRNQLIGTGLNHLDRLTGLRNLDLAKTQLDDQGFARLPALPTLESLNIAGTKVTDACLTALQRSSITMSRAHLIKERLRRCPQGVVYGRRGGSFPSVRMSQG
jgi:hypothetical protein